MSAADVSRVSRLQSRNLVLSPRYTGHGTFAMTTLSAGLPGGRVRDRTDKCRRGRSRRRFAAQAATPAHASFRLGMLFARHGRGFFSQQHLHWDAGCQPWHGPSAPPAPPTERERQCGGRKAPPSVAPLRSAQIGTSTLRRAEAPRQARPYPSRIPQMDAPAAIEILSNECLTHPRHPPEHSQESNAESSMRNCRGAPEHLPPTPDPASQPEPAWRP